MSTTAALKLWEVGDELSEIAVLIMEAEGELTPELAARLDMMEGAFEDKIERIALKVRELEANAKAAKEEADRLAKIHRSFTNAAKRLKDYTLFEMQRVGRDKVETHRAKVRVQDNSRPSIRWEGDPKKAPFLYQRVTVEIDGTYAYEAWKRGDELPEGFTVERGSHVRIY